jgi:competence protein ComEC
MHYEHPILILLVSLVAGCIAEYFLIVPVSSLVPVSLLSILVLTAWMKRRTFFAFVLVLFWFGWGMTALSLRFDDSSSHHGISTFEGKQVVVEGLLVRRPAVVREGQRFELAIEKILYQKNWFRVDGRLLVTVAKGQGNWLTGDRIRFPATIRIPRLLGLPGEFNYPRHLALRGFNATAFVKHVDDVVLMRHAAKPSLQRKIDALAVQSQEFIRHAVSDAGQRGVLLALATGTQQEIDPTMATAYARAGVSHILSVSGFHVGVVTAAWVFFFRWLFLRWEWLALRIDVRRTVLLTALPVMLIYLVFTGGAPATARSVLMLSVVVLAAWSEREVDTLDALLLAAFLLVLIDPGVLFDLSFQLSFLALWGLLVLTPLISAPFERFLKQGWERALLLLCAASLAAIMTTMAPVLAAFHQSSCTGVLANLVVVPLLGYGATVLASVAVPISFVVPVFAWVLFQSAGLLVQISNIFVNWIAEIPVVHSYSSGPADLLVTIALLAVISFIRSTRIRIISGTVLCLGLIAFHVWPIQPSDGRMRMTFLSVGQGEATLISLPDGRIMLVDGGGYLHATGRDFGEQYLIPALHALKVKQVDIMVLTHPHPDHMGGLPAVAEQFVVGELWQGSDSGQSADYNRLIEALSRQRTKLRFLHQGDKPLESEGLDVTVLSPSTEPQSGTVDNEDSLVLRVQQGEFSALLMGDAGFPVENELIRQGIGETTVLKAGHHGSKNASSDKLLRSIKPRIVVISVGNANSFGLPAVETVERIVRQGSTLYRTDRDGSIQVTSDGKSWTVCPLPTESRFVTVARRFVLTADDLLR